MLLIGSNLRKYPKAIIYPLPLVLIIIGRLYALFTNKQTPMNFNMQLEVNGVLTAVFIEEIPHRYHNMCRASFQNGYENIFFTDCETGKWIEETWGLRHLRQPWERKFKSTSGLPFMFLNCLPGTISILIASIFPLDSSCI